MGLSATLANALLRLNVAQQALSVTANNVANASAIVPTAPSPASRGRSGWAASPRRRLRAPKNWP
jgi:hypothetical protein